MSSMNLDMSDDLSPVPFAKLGPGPLEQTKNGRIVSVRDSTTPLNVDATEI